MFKTIDDIMYITDGNNPFRIGLIYGTGGLGYKPTPYNMIGGSLGEEEPEKIKELMTGSIEDMEKVLRAHEKARENIEKGIEYDDENIRKSDLEDINKIIDSIQRKIGRKEIQEEEEYFKSEDFLDQMKWYEDNYDNLGEDELYIYIESLAKLKEIENRNIDKSKINKTTELDKKLFNAINDYEIITGKESGLQYEDAEDIKTEIFEWYIKKIKPEHYNNEFIDKSRILLKNNFEEIGNLCERYYGTKKELFEFINKGLDKSNVLNTSLIDTNNYYTNEMKIEGNKNIYIGGFNKKKADFYLADFVSDKNIYEMKALKDSYNDFYNKGYIHLVGTKISENKNFVGDFRFDKNNNKVVIDNIGYRDNVDEHIKFKTLNGSNYNYYSIFCLSDGMYYCNLSNPNLWIIDKNNKAYFKFPKDNFGNVKIPIQYIERIDNSFVDKLNK